MYTPGLRWGIADRLGLTARLESYLTRVLCDDDGLELFTCQGWRRIFRIRLVIYQELCWEFFSTAQFDTESRIYVDRSVLTFHLGRVSHSCSIVELGQRLGIYTDQEVASPHFLSYIDS